MTSEDVRFELAREHSHLATAVLLAATDPVLDTFTPLRFRPVFVVHIETQDKHHAGDGPVVQVLINWQHLAVLHGQVRAARTMLPVHLRDQWRSMERETYEASLEVAAEGRPDDDG